MHASLKACAAAALVALGGCALQQPQSPATSGRLLLSGNDGKLPMIDGAYKVANPPVPDTLTVLDASSFPPRKVAEIEIQHTVTAPPMTIAITHDEKLALVSAANRVDPKDKAKVATDTYMQVVDLESSPPRVIDKVELGHHPLGVAVNRAGTLALAAHQDGYVSVMGISGKTVKKLDTLKIGEPSSSPRSVAITPDGKWAFLGRRGDDVVALLSIAGDKVAYTRRDITVGSNPYGIEVSDDGRFAAVANVGRGDGSNDSVTIIDLTREPFRAVEHFTVGQGPEGLAISPDSRYIAIGTANGTNKPKSSPFFADNGLLTLYEYADGRVRKVGEARTGHNTQGVQFTPDGRHVVVQNYVEKELAFYRVTDAGPVDTGVRIAVPGHPAGMRIAH